MKQRHQVVTCQIAALALSPFPLTHLPVDYSGLSTQTWTTFFFSGLFQDGSSHPNEETRSQAGRIIHTRLLVLITFLYINENSS